MTDWIDHAVFWHIYPLGFVGAGRTAPANGAISHRLCHIVDWLDYAVRLGVSGLLLGPIFASSTHGYDTTDYFRIDPRLGDEADFDELIKEARRRGLNVVLDGVFNHVGRSFPAFQAALRGGPNADEASWFRVTWPLGQGADTEPDYATFEGHRELVALNHDEPAVRDHVVEVMNHWLDRGASGWRLDAAYAVPRSFWADVAPKVRRKHPRAYLLGEVIHGDYSSFVRASKLDTVTQYELWKAIWSALNDRNLFELAWALDRHNGLLTDFAPLTFLGNHDVTRLASRLNDERHIGHAIAVLLTVGGTPCIYSGDEQAFRGIKEDRAGGDDAVRPAFPDRPEGLASFGSGIFRMHQDVIGVRRRHPWLHRARSAVLHLTNRQMAIEISADGHRLFLALNLDDSEITLPLPGARAILAGDGRLGDGNGARASLHLSGHAWAILSA